MAEASSASIRGVVARVDFGSCVLLLDDDQLAPAIVRGRLMGRRKALGNAVVVGDRAVASPGTEGERLTIEEVEPRRNAFSRRAPGRQPVEQVLAANLDQVLLVTAIADPEFSPGLTDRVLCQAEHAGIPVHLVLNKADLAVDAEARARLGGLIEDYARAGCPGHAVSAKTREGLDELRSVLRGRRTLFIGHSGVGKSTLLNTLVPELDALVGHVNAKTGRGRHTTTALTLLRPEPDIELIDSPGVRVFGLWGIGAGDLDQGYREFRPYLGACRFGDCAHDTEPGCAVRAAVERGEIAALRHASYLKLREELKQEGTLGNLRETGWT